VVGGDRYGEEVGARCGNPLPFFRVVKIDGWKGGKGEREAGGVLAVSDLISGTRLGTTNAGKGAFGGIEAKLSIAAARVRRRFHFPAGFGIGPGDVVSTFKLKLVNAAVRPSTSKISAVTFSPQ